MERTTTKRKKLKQTMTKPKPKPKKREKKRQRQRLAVLLPPPRTMLGVQCPKRPVWKKQKQGEAKQAEHHKSNPPNVAICLLY